MLALRDIPPGSCILWSGDYVISRLIRWFSHSKFSHASLVTSDPDLECAIVEAEATGLELRELRELMADYKGQVWVFIPDALRFQDAPSLRKIAITECAKHRPYDYKGLFANIVRHTSIHAHKFFCSAWAWFVWLQLKWVTGIKAPRPGEIPTRTRGHLERIK